MTLEERIQELRDQLEFLGTDGIWNREPYWYGFYNGAALCLGIMEGKAPQYKPVPDNWVGENDDPLELSI
jgi:hypothetical protein